MSARSTRSPGAWLAAAPTAVLAALLAAGTACAQDYPKLRPGLWELSRSSDRAPDAAQRTTICLDDATQRQMYQAGLGAMGAMCSKHEFHLHGARGEGEFICAMGPTTVHTKAVMTLQGDTAYRTDIDTTYDPPMNGTAHSHSVLLARHTGACKPGQRPGDMILPNGRSVNMHDAIPGQRQAK
jgi:uncharacterized protein DUF3617